MSTANRAPSYKPAGKPHKTAIPRAPAINVESNVHQSESPKNAEPEVVTMKSTPSAETVDRTTEKAPSRAPSENGDAEYTPSTEMLEKYFARSDRGPSNVDTRDSHYIEKLAETNMFWVNFGQWWVQYGAGRVLGFFNTRLVDMDEEEFIKLHVRDDDAVCELDPSAFQVKDEHGEMHDAPLAVAPNAGLIVTSGFIRRIVRSGAQARAEFCSMKVKFYRRDGEEVRFRALKPVAYDDRRPAPSNNGDRRPPVNRDEERAQGPPPQKFGAYDSRYVESRMEKPLGDDHERVAEFEHRGPLGDNRNYRQSDRNESQYAPVQRATNSDRRYGSVNPTSRPPPSDQGGYRSGRGSASGRGGRPWRG